MESVPNQVEWVEDASLGVAVREVGEGLYLHAITAAGAKRIRHAGRVAGAIAALSTHRGDFVGVPQIHRVAFARALSPDEHWASRPTFNCPLCYKVNDLAGEAASS